jgi:hypothetical protein
VRHGAGDHLFYSGGTFTNDSYGQSYASAPSPTGPFAKPSERPLLATVAGAVEGPGGGSVVAGPPAATGSSTTGAPPAAVRARCESTRLCGDDSAAPPAAAVRGPTTTPQEQP